MQIIECKTAEEILSTYPLMKQLQSTRVKDEFFTEKEYLNRVTELMKSGYRIARALNNDSIIGVVTFRRKSNLFMNIMYVEELVIDEILRSKGFGKQLLRWVEKEARKHSCDSMELDCGMHRTKAHKFYFCEDFEINTFYFMKRLNK